MSRSRFLTQVEMDLRFHFTRPLFWVLVISLVLVSWGLSSGNVAISSGDSSIGGEARAWITSEFSIGMMFPLVTFLLYSFFVAVAAGMAVPRDDELRVGPILHGTPLRAGEYVWGKFAAVSLLFLVVLVFHLLATIVCNQLLPNANADLIRGPFALVNYLRPALVLAVPFLVFLLGTSFAVGELTRRPILVFVTPVALFLVSIFFLWSWSPSWLDPTVNRVLGWIEPSGFRWLNETWLKVDLGVEHYNHHPIEYDGPFLASRLVYLLLGLGFAFGARRHFEGTLRGEREPAPPRWWSRLLRRRRPWSPEPAETLPTAREAGGRALGALGMTVRVPSFLRTVVDVARFEAKGLASQPGLYIFVPLILLQTIGQGLFQVGAFDTPLLLTPGQAAVSSMNTLTLLVCFLLLFYTAESLAREWVTGLAPIAYASPVRTSALLTGKALANGIVGVTILAFCYLGAAIVMLVEGKVTPTPVPFVIVWGLLLVPTFLVWSAFVTAVLAITRSRLATYGAGLAVMAFTGWKQSEGEINWVGNWDLWGTTTWTDFGGLEPNGLPLLLNRLFWLSVAALLLHVAVQTFPRPEHDSARIVDRLRPRGLLAAAGLFAPAAIPAVILGSTLAVLVDQGFQGDAVQRREEEYHARNLLTWANAELPQLVDVDIDLALEPDERWFEVTGTYELENRSDGLIRRFPMSIGDHFEEVTWTLDGEAFEPESSARLEVFEPDVPLSPGDRVVVGFSHHGRFPAGITENGGGMSEFILPSGVVLTGFTSSFVPVPAFEPERGIDEDNRLEPKRYEEGFWEGPTDPALGSGARYTVRTRITGPDRFRYHGVGVLEEEVVADGRRTAVWRADHPVNFFNVVAGEWAEWRGEGVELYYHPGHDYNVEEIGKALEAARRHYSEWFYPYPWRDLKISEFPGLASYAQGFPTNITFSESIGFLTQSTPEAQVAFMVTAHETAHQWWANILLQGEGPGGNILSEGMAHFSTILLTGEVLGEQERIEFCQLIEARYGDNRQVDSERPLVWTDGSRAGDTTVTYDKGGWVAWMLLQHLGRETGLAAIRDFIGRYAENDDDYPLLQDFVAVVREHAPDVEAYDELVEQWFFDVVVPEYRVDEAAVAGGTGSFTVTATVTNRGTGRMPVEIAAVRGERFPDDDEEEAPAYREARTLVTLGAGETTTVEIATEFEPEKVLVDPDALVLMLNRDLAERKVGPV